MYAVNKSDVPPRRGDDDELCFESTRAVCPQLCTAGFLEEAAKSLLCRCVNFFL